MDASIVEKIVKEIEQFAPAHEGQHVGRVLAVGDGVVAMLLADFVADDAEFFAIKFDHLAGCDADQIVVGFSSCDHFIV